MKKQIWFALFITIAMFSFSFGQVLSVKEAIKSEPIPRDQYRTWSLFLICNQNWILPEAENNIKSLYIRYQLFGNAIGKDNLAVWFSKNNEMANYKEFGQTVDIERSVEYCKVLKLLPSKGPYLVITDSYPDLRSFPPENAIFELEGMNMSDVSKLLGELTDDLVVSGKVKKQSRRQINNRSKSINELWINLLESARISMIQFGCSVKFQLNTGLLTAELKSCP
jgi:hypothetical protein